MVTVYKCLHQLNKKKKDLLGPTKQKKSGPRTHIKNISQNNKIFIKDTLKRKGFKKKKYRINCYFHLKNILLR